MARYTNTAESGQPSGTAITTLAQTGGTAGEAFTKAQSFFDGGSGGVRFTDQSAHGALAYQLGYLNTSGSGGWRSLAWEPEGPWDTLGRLAARWYFWVDVLAPAGTVEMGAVRNMRPSTGGVSTAASCVSIARTASGAIELRLGGMSSAVVFTSPSGVLTAGQWYRFEVRAKANSAFGVADGEVEFAAFVGDSPEPIPGTYWYSNTVQTRGDYEPNANQVPAAMLFGQSSSGLGQTPYVRQERWDDLVMYTGADATSLPGPVLPAPVSVARPYVVTENPGLWFPTGVGDLVEAVSDDEDLTFAESPGADINEVLEYALPPLTSGSLRVVTRARQGSSANELQVEVLQTDTVIATRTFTLTATVADYELVCSPSELAAITDRSKLRVRLTGSPA